MPDRPLILFPSPERADREHKPSVFTRTVKPSFGRQFTRLQPSFNVLRTAFEQKAVKVQQSPVGINPDFALVFEIIGTVDNFYTAVQHTEGLEWILIATLTHLSRMMISIKLIKILVKESMIL